MKKLLPMLFCFLAPAVSFGQGSVVNDIALKNLVTGIAPAAGATVTVCTSAGTGIPCTPLATVYSDIALTVPLTNPLTADSNGYYSFFAAAGTYIVTITGAGTSGRSVTYTLPFTLSGNNAFTGTNTFTGPLNCKNIEASIFCIDTANTQGWAGADAGAQINSAIAAWPSTGGRLLIASGVYTVSTPITGAQNGTIQCSAAPATSAGRAVLTFTPATGNMLTWSNSSFQLFDCDLKTTTSTTSIGLQLTHVNYKTNIERNHINGFFGGIKVTGDGVSAYSTGVHIANNLIDGISANCGGGAGYGINFDHARDVTYDENQIYSVTDCATGVPMILDTGVGGIWMSGSTFEQGLHAGVIRNTNQGGAYGGVPAAIFPHGITWDLPPGGDALLFDSTLGSSNIRFFCASCWAVGAGKNTAGTVITTGAIGINIQGGANIHFVGGTSHINASWGALLGTAGTNISFEGMNFQSNNQGNTANVGGVLVAGPTGWRLVNNRSGNILDSGGNQAWGFDISGASSDGVISDNDLRNNTSGRIKMPATFGSASVDAPDFGSLTGMEIIGPLRMPGGTNFSAGTAGEAVCGSNTSSVLTCSYNSGTVGSVPLMSIANTGLAGFTLNMAASTAANSFVAPAQAGLTSGTDGAIAYDTTGKITHIRTNGADSDAAATTTTSTTTTQVLHATAVAGIYAPSAVVTADIATALTTPGPIGGTTPGTGKFTSMTATNLLWSTTAPTIAGAGCGGSAATIPNQNGTAAFTINVGTAPTAGGCTVTLPTATTGWNCFVTDITTNSTAVFLQKQLSSTTTQAVLVNYSDVAVATAPTASDIWRVSCFAY